MQSLLAIYNFKHQNQQQHSYLSKMASGNMDQNWIGRDFSTVAWPGRTMKSQHIIWSAARRYSSSHSFENGFGQEEQQQATDTLPIVLTLGIAIGRS
jgi:hypothetical protein